MLSTTHAMRGSAPHRESGLSTPSKGRWTEVVTEETRVLNNTDVSGIRIAITGGTSGLGLALVR